MVSLAADLTLGVAGIDQLEWVAIGEGVDGDAEPDEAEQDEEQQTDYVGAGALAVGSFVGWIIVHLVSVFIITATTHRTTL